MKKLFTLFVAILLAGSLWALGPDEAHGKAGGEGRMKERLGLSDEQAKKLEALREADQKEMKAAHRKVRDLMAKLEDQVEDKASDSAIAATLKELDAAHKDRQAAMEKAKAAREAILSPTQRAKFLLKMRGHGMGMGKGMGGEGREKRKGGREERGGHEGSEDEGAEGRDGHEGPAEQERRHDGGSHY